MKMWLIIVPVAIGLAGCGASSLESIGAVAPAGLTETKAGPIETGSVDTGSIAEPKALRAREAREAAQSIARVSTPSSNAYRIGAQDVLDVSVFKVPDLSKTLEVSDGGTINFPLLGDLQVAGLTTREVEARLKRRLEQRYLQNAQLTVSVKEFNSQRVTMDGAFKKPGVYPLRGRMTLLQAVAGAQGLHEDAQNTVLLFREVKGKRAAAKFDVAGIRAGTLADPVIRPGDVVVANTSNTMRAFKALGTMLPMARFLLLL